jgi:heme A synthase
VRVRRTPEVDALTVRLSTAAVVLVAVQIALGAANIWWRLSAWSVVPHLLVGATIWLTALTVVHLVRWHGAPVQHEQRSHVRTLVTG